MDEVSIKAAKDDRTKTKRLFTMSVTSMDRAIRENTSNEIVSEKFTVICRHWEDVSDKLSYLLW